MTPKDTDETITLLRSDYIEMVEAAFRLADAIDDALDSEDGRVVGETYQAIVAALAVWNEASPNRAAFPGVALEPIAGPCIMPVEVVDKEEMLRRYPKPDGAS